MSRTKDILYALPSTAPELAALFDSTTKHVNAALCYLREQGLATRTRKRGARFNNTGRWPHLWIRAKSK